jgi:hypothetical protein
MIWRFFVLPDRFQKQFISAREFVASWDKEIYELTNLDYFIFLMVNHLGNQLEKRFFIRHHKESPLFLDFDCIGTLCFNLGDSFEYFLEDDFLGSDNSDYMLNPDTSDDFFEKEEEIIHRRIKKLNSFLSKEYFCEDDFRVELMHTAILDTLIQFYYEELGIEIGDEDEEIIELAEFIVDEMIHFIRYEGQSLLQRPADPAMDHFEGLLETDEEYPPDEEWEEDAEAVNKEESNWVSDNPHFEDISQTIQKFINNRDSNPPETIASATADIRLFQKFLTEHICINNIYEICDEHFLEFLSVWLIKEFVHEEEPQFSQIYHTMARFITWLANNYNLDYRQSYRKYYDSVKTEVPRLVRALNKYLDEYDLFEIFLTRGQTDSNQVSGFFEISKVRNRFNKTLDLINLHLDDEIENVRLNSSILSKLKQGDLLQATLIQKGNYWEVLEIHYIYPLAAKSFVY